MDSRKSTPRNKVYPEGEGAVLTQRPSGRASSAAPADGAGEALGLAALQLDARARTEGRAAARSLLHFYVFKVLPPVGVVCVVLFALFAGFSYAVPRLLCHKFAVESSVRRHAPALRLGGRIHRLGESPIQDLSSPVCALSRRAPSLGSRSASSTPTATTPRPPASRSSGCSSGRPSTRGSASSASSSPWACLVRGAAVLGAHPSLPASHYRG